MASPNVFAGLLQQPRSVIDYMGQLEAQDASAMGRQVQGAQLQQMQRKNALEDAAMAQAAQERNALAALIPQAGGDPAKLSQLLMQSSNPSLFAKGQELQKAAFEAQKTQAGIGKDTATTQETQGKTLDASLKRYRAMLDMVDTPQAAARWLQAQYSDPQVSAVMAKMGPLEQSIASIPQDPQGFAQWRQRSAMGMEKFIEMQQRAATAAGTQANQLMVPGPDGSFVPNAPLVEVKTALAKAAQRPRGGGGGGGGLAPASTTLSGDEFLATLPAADRAIVKGIADGSIVPNDISTKGNRREQMLAWAKQYAAGANLTGRKPETDKPLPAKERQSLTEARANAATIDSLLTGFKDDYASKGVLGFGADASLGAKAVLGTDTDSVQWWKNYRKQAELVERHAMFGASLTEGEKAAWASADISPKMDAKVIRANLQTRAALTKKVLEATQQDLIDSGFGEDRVRKIGGRDVRVPLGAAPSAPAGWKIERE